MSSLLTQEEINLLLEDSREYEETYYGTLTSEAFAVCIIKKVNDKITEYILSKGKSPTCDIICNYYYGATHELLKYLCERKDQDEILELVNENISNYKCKVRLYISPVDGELKKY